VGTDLDAYGWAMLKRLLSAEECQAIAALYKRGGDFRSHIVMARHGFGRGEYKYFAYPLPKIIAELRGALYARLAPIANRWNAAVDLEVRYPAAHAEFIERCHKPDRLAQHRSCSSTAETITTACTRISTASMSSRFRSHFCCRSQKRTSPAASSC
jgi:hypothetical protein